MSHDLQRLIDSSADYIAQHQVSSGAIPWFHDGVLDPWDHVECAIALDLAGRHEEAKRAYNWLSEVQNPDGSWWYSYFDGKPQKLSRDTNYCSYIAVGIWCHYLTTGDISFLRKLWPAVEKAISFTLTLQQPTGEIYWGLGPDNAVWDRALIASSSCIWLSLRCAVKIAETLGQAKPIWDEASVRLATAIREHPEYFDNYGYRQYDFSMSWFYPVLTGVINGSRGRNLILSRWDDFVIEGWGCKCVAEAPYWVTVAETCELIVTLARVGEHARARQLMDWILRLQDCPGSFWSGIKIPEEVVWPEEKPSWISAAFIIAATQVKNGNKLIPKFSY